VVTAITTNNGGTMSSSSRRLSAITALLLLLGVLVPILMTAPADAAGALKCGKWTYDSGSSTQYRSCVKVTKIKPIVKQDGNYLLHNSSSHQTVKATCAWDHSTTLTWKLEGTVKAEAGLIFSKVSAEVTSGVAHSTTDSTHLGFEFKLKPKKWAYCARGHAAFDVAGQAMRQVCTAQETGCHFVNVRDFSGRIPSSSFLDYGPGRNIDWSQYLPQD
jgi:hypothetical protein